MKQTLGSSALWRQFGRSKLTGLGNGGLIFVMLTFIWPSGPRAPWIILGVVIAMAFYLVSFLRVLRQVKHQPPSMPSNL